MKEQTEIKVEPLYSISPKKRKKEKKKRKEKMES